MEQDHKTEKPLTRPQKEEFSAKQYEGLGLPEGVPEMLARFDYLHSTWAYIEANNLDREKHKIKAAMDVHVGLFADTLPQTFRIIENRLTNYQHFQESDAQSLEEFRKDPLYSTVMTHEISFNFRLAAEI